MNSTTTHYQTSFKADDSDGKAFYRLKSSVYGWVLSKEIAEGLREKKNDFFFRCHWPDLFQTHSAITTDTFRDKGGDAWAFHYAEVDGQHGRARFWHSDIGLKQAVGVVIVSVRVSFAWNTEYLNNEPEPPVPSVPRVIRYMLDGNKVFSGRPEFQLIDKAIRFTNVGEGNAVCGFIQSPERRYPLIVFNGDSREHVYEAEQLAFQLTGKCQVVVIGENKELAEEIQHYLPEDYWVQANRMRVYFPFNIRRNTPDRHRWYNVYNPHYLNQRQGMVNGLLRHNSVVEIGAVESVEDIRRLVSRLKLLRVKPNDPEERKVLEEFLVEHAQVAQERDDAKNEAKSYANQVDDLEKDNNDLRWKIENLQMHLGKAGEEETAESAKLLPTLPTTLLEVAETATRFFPRLVVTEAALKSARDFSACTCCSEAWEMLWQLSETLHPLKFVDRESDLEGKFNSKTRYELAMSEGKMTKDDSKLMRLRIFHYGGKEFDITPHLKHGNKEPKQVRIYFAFDEETRKIVIGHIGRHIPNYTSKKF